MRSAQQEQSTQHIPAAKQQDNDKDKQIKTPGQIHEFIYDLTIYD